MGELLFVIVISLILSAFFSAVELAYVTANPLRLTLTRNEKSRTARLLNYYYENPDYFLGTTLIGNTLTLVIYGVYASALIDAPVRDFVGSLMTGEENSAWFDMTVLVAQTTLSTAVVLLVAEFTPKSIAMAMPNAAIEFMIHIMHVFAFLLRPFVWIVVRSNEFLLVRVLRLKKDQDGNKKAGIADLSHYLLNRGGKSNEQQQNEAIDAAIFKNAIEFKSRKVRNCMVPRTDIIAVDIRQSVEDLSRAFTTSGRTKIIIFDGNLDNVVGYCHALKLFDDPETIAQVTVPILIVPETTALQEMMYQFLTNHRSIAVVTDEFGGTAGIVTIEDVIEEILGEIVDEHDRDTEPFVKIAENHFEMSGKTKIDELIEKLNLNIPEGEYDTVGGYIMSYLGEVPAVNAVVETEDYLMTVLEMKGVRVEKVSLLIKKT